MILIGINFYQWAGVDNTLTQAIITTLFVVSLAAFLSHWFGGMTIGSITLPGKNKKLTIFGATILLLIFTSVLPIWSKGMKDDITYHLNVEDQQFIQVLKRINRIDLNYNVIIDPSLDTVKTRNITMNINGTTEEMIQFICKSATLHTKITYLKEDRNIYVILDP